MFTTSIGPFSSHFARHEAALGSTIRIPRGFTISACACVIGLRSMRCFASWAVVESRPRRLKLPTGTPSKRKTPPASVLLMKAAGVPKGSGEPNRVKVAKVTPAQVEEIAKQKMPDLNAADVEGATKIIAGTARSMGIDIG